MAYFEPTSGERRGLIILSVALLLTIGAGVYSWLSHPNEEHDTTSASLSRRAEKHRTQKYFAVPERQVETFAFDPNTADSTTLLRLGFPAFMVRSIYKYRAAGGRYHEPADLQRMYGMTNELWDRLAAYVHIDRKYRYVDPMPRRAERRMATTARDGRTEQHESDAPLVARRDTVRFPVKLNVGETISLNDADTIQLKRIPGIGSYFARQIVRYRDRLGGYVSLAQLYEIASMPEDVGQWLTLDASDIRRIDVNHATNSQLMRHPYMRAGHVAAIRDRLHHAGPLQDMDDLCTLPGFTAEDAERLAPYLEFK